MFALLAAAVAFADLPKPSPEQLAWHETELGMFIHLAPNTWQDREWDDLSTPLDQIDPKELDTDQWARVAVSMGAKYIVFVAKHVGGFCWWQTDTAEYSVRNTPWRGGKGDVMADLAKSCEKHGLKLGVYLSPRDFSQNVEGGGEAETPEAQEAYIKLFKTQLTELLTRYGPIFEVWFDGSLVFDVSDVLNAHAPKAIVFQGPQANIRWVGNEDGYAPDPCWNGAVYDPQTWGTLTAADGNPDGDRWLPNEVDCRIRDTWFWNTRNDGALKSLDQLMDMYENSVGHGAVMLLNHAPDRSGLIPEADARRAAEFGAEIKRRYGRSIADAGGKGMEVLVGPSAPSLIDAVVLQEDIREGERVREYVVEARVKGEWVELSRGTAIGYKKIDKFEPVRVSSVRLRVLRAVGEPIIKRLALHRTAN